MQKVAHGILAAVLTPLAWLSAPVAAQTDEAVVVDQTVAAERLRAQVESVFVNLSSPTDRGEHAAPLFTWITDRLQAIGPGIGPLMIAELDNRSRVTFNIATYMIGLQAPAGGKEALLRAAEAANRDGGEFAKDRLAWIVYGVALLGDPSSVNLLDSGKLNVVRKPFADDMNILEMAAILTAPESRPLLLEKLDRYGADPDLQDRIYPVLYALRRVADPSIIDRVTPYLKHSESWVRDGAARALAATGDPRVADRLFAAIDDTDPYSKFGAAYSIEVLKPAGKAKAILAKLDVEEYTAARGALYRTLAATAPESQVIQTFASAWGRPDPIDRVAIVNALGTLRSRKGLNLLRTALKDPDLRVPLHAIDSMAAIGGSGVTDTLLALLTDPRGPVEAAAIRILSGQKERRAAPRIADRFRAQIAVPIVDPVDRDSLQCRGNALIDLRDTTTLPNLQAAADHQPDPAVQGILSSLIVRMSALKEFGDDRARWIFATSSKDPQIRALAYSRLVEIPGPESVQALSDAFGRVNVSEGFEILRALGKLGTIDAAPLVERILLEPAFDSYERHPLRSMAAWAALRIGGERMSAALRASVERRDGRDAEVLVYLAILDGAGAIPVLDAHRNHRMRYFDWQLGKEWDRLDWLEREIRAGRSVDSLNKPPDEIALYPIML